MITRFFERSVVLKRFAVKCWIDYIPSPFKLTDVLSLTEHHAMKAYWGSGDTAPPIL